MLGLFQVYVWGGGILYIVALSLRLLHVHVSDIIPCYVHEIHMYNVHHNNVTFKIWKKYRVTLLRDRGVAKHIYVQTWEGQTEIHV